jgi:hypothetical protein
MMIFVFHTLFLASLGQPSLHGGVRGLSKENDGKGGHFSRRLANAGGVKDGTDDSSFRVGLVDSLLKVAGISGNGVDVDDEEQVSFIV